VCGPFLQTVFLQGRCRVFKIVANSALLGYNNLKRNKKQAIETSLGGILMMNKWKIEVALSGRASRCLTPSKQSESFRPAAQPALGYSRRRFKKSSILPRAVTDSVEPGSLFWNTCGIYW